MIKTKKKKEEKKERGTMSWSSSLHLPAKPANIWGGGGKNC